MKKNYQAPDLEIVNLFDTLVEHGGDEVLDDMFDAEQGTASNIFQ